MSTQIQDGTVKWETKDIRVKAIVDLLYPVGTVIAVANDNTPAFTKYGTWEKVGSGRVLWGADSSHPAGTTIEAGLPNITGHDVAMWADNDAPFFDGAFYAGIPGKSGIRALRYGQYGTTTKTSVTNMFDASRSNSIYGASDTVQPPAYVVNFWRRTA